MRVQSSTLAVALAVTLAVTLAATIATVGTAAPAGAQEVNAANARLRVFLECRARGCDFDYFRREIDFVDWMRDREDADVHLLITSEQTGGGGQALDLAFLGRRAYEAVSDTITHTSAGTDTQDERRIALAEVIRAGLVPYLAEGGQLGLVRIRSRDAVPEIQPGAGPPRTESEQTLTEDPWDFWVFRVGMNAFLSGQSSSSSSNTSANISASRTTELWKSNVRVSGSYNKQTFELTGGKQSFITRNYFASGSIVRSLTDRWSTGVQGSALHNTQRNQDLTIRTAPAIEYNVYPYAESSRRQWIFQYSVGVNSFDYTEETLFTKTSEVLWDHTLATAIEQTQPWGSLQGDISASQFLNQTDKYSVRISGGANLRLTRGLSLRINGSYSWVRDQLHLPGSELEDDEILLRLRDLETSFRYFTSIGFSYQFGSIFNNVVNPRLRFRGRGGGDFFF